MHSSDFARRNHLLPQPYALCCFYIWSESWITRRGAKFLPGRPLVENITAKIQWAFFATRLFGMNGKDKTHARRERIWQIVHTIPPGKVATYGQVAVLADLPRGARLVGYVMSRLPNGSRLPWHRVINARGKLSTHSTSRQRELLQAEGVVFFNGRIYLSRYQWKP